MPTVLRWNGYRFYFFSNEGSEPPHIHIDRGGSTAKYWLTPVALARNIGYSAKELKEIEAKVSAESAALLEAWRVHFG
ncbi:MAG: DUF4160 domain-containing protein [Alphaproteobacteria bacterium]|nr:DUF4160 domain-containing protein [Alphaproteobacteria bacterium]